MNATINAKLDALRLRLEYSPAQGKTPVVPIKVIPVKPRLAKPTRDDEPTEADCARVGGVLKMVFGRAMCLPSGQTNIVGVPAVQRRVREQLEWMRAQLEADMHGSGHFDYIGRGDKHIVVHHAGKKPKGDEKKHKEKMKRIADIVTADEGE